MGNQNPLPISLLGKIVSAKNKHQELKLFSFKGNLYPADAVDYELLKQRGVLIYRIPETSLALLQKTSLTKLQIAVVPFPTIWGPFANSFALELKSYGAVKAVSMHEYWLRLTPTGDDEKRLRDYLYKMSKFISRYCIKLSIDQIHKDGELRLKIKFIYNEEINNSYAFKNPEVADSEVIMEITSCVRLVLSHKEISGSPFLTWKLQDLVNGSWVDYSNRSSAITEKSKEQLRAVAHYMLNLT